MNRYRLNPRELEILSAIEQGYSYRQIAENFRITQDTVSHHVRNIFRKLGVLTRWEIALRSESGLLRAIFRRVAKMPPAERLGRLIMIFGQVICLLALIAWTKHHWR